MDSVSGRGAKRIQGYDLAMAQLSSPGLLTGAAVFWLVSFLRLSDSVCGYLESLAAGSLPGRLAGLFFTGYYPVFFMGRALSFRYVVGAAGFKKPHVTMTLLGSGLLAAVL